MCCKKNAPTAGLKGPKQAEFKLNELKKQGVLRLDKSKTAEGFSCMTLCLCVCQMSGIWQML